MTGSPKHNSSHSGFSHPDYEFLGEISRGGMGVIYRARHRLLNVDHAFKVILSDKVDFTLIERFEREAQTLAALNHPHILKIHKYGSVNGSPYLVTDLIDGRDLSSELKDNPLAQDFDWLSERLIELASALEYCHEQGVVHRDLKPGNVIIRRDTGEVVLIDFGLVKNKVDSGSLEALSKTGDWIGTPGYMAPEQFDGSGQYGEVGPGSDVWSFGVLLYFSLTGREPFQGASIYHFYKSILHSTPEPIQAINDDAPESLIALTVDCLQKDGRNRPTMAELKHRLESAGEPENVGKNVLPVVLTSVVVLFLLFISSTIYNATQDSTNPIVELTIPKKGLYKERLSIVGIVNEDNCRVTLNGHELPIQGRKFQFTWPLSAAGTSYRVIVTDSAGNTSLSEGRLKRSFNVSVGESDNCEFKTITEALQSVPENVVIRVKPGRYAESLTLTTKHRIEAEALGAEVLIVTKKQRCVLVKGGAPSLRGLTFRLEDKDKGKRVHAIVVVGGTLTLEDCRVRSEGGHGIMVTGRGSRLKAERCWINENNNVGVFVDKEGLATLDHCQISSNFFHNARCENAELRLRDCRLNNSKRAMGLFAGLGSLVYAKNCVLEGNRSQGVRAISRAKLRMENCIILNTKIGLQERNGKIIYSGGGVYGHKNSSILLQECRIGGHAGDGVWVNHVNNTLILKNCEIFRNGRSGVRASGKRQRVELTDCNIYENGKHGLDSQGAHKIVLRGVVSSLNKEHGYHFKDGVEVKASDCKARSNNKIGIALFKDCVSRFVNFQSFENGEAGFFVRASSRFQGEKCQSKGNLHGLFAANSQIKWVGGEIRNNKKYGLSGVNGASFVLKDIEVSGNRSGPSFYDRSCKVGRD